MAPSVTRCGMQREAVNVEMLYILIPIGLAVVAVAAYGFAWAIRNGQFEDLEGPAYRILMDDDDPRIPVAPPRDDEDEPKT